MSQLQGTLIISPIVPPTTEDLYGTHYAKYGIGGYRSVQNLTERNSISQERRELMMLVGVISENKIYQLSESLDNTGWIEYKSIYESSGSGYTLIDNSNNKIKSIQTGSNVYIIDSNGELSINSVSHSIQETGSGTSLLINNKIKRIGNSSEISVSDINNTLYFNNVHGIFSASTSTGNYSIDFLSSSIQSITPSGSVVSMSYSNITPGKMVKLKIQKSPENYVLYIPETSVVYSPYTYSTNINLNKSVQIEFICYGTYEYDVDVNIKLET